MSLQLPDIVRIALDDTESPLLQSNRFRDISRPSTAPSETIPTTKPVFSSSEVPRIAIYGDTFTLRSLRRTPTLSDLSFANTSKSSQTSRSTSYSLPGTVSSDRSTDPSETGRDREQHQQTNALARSDGIETSPGLSTALVTRKTLRLNAPRRARSPAANTITHRFKSLLKKTSKRSLEQLDQEHARKPAIDSAGAAALESVPDELLNCTEPMPPRQESSSPRERDGASGDGDSPHQSGAESSQESDLFLKLAQDVPEAAQDGGTSRLEQRSSRGYRSIQRSSLPVNNDALRGSRRGSLSQGSGYGIRDSAPIADGPRVGQRRSSVAAPSVYSTVSTRSPAGMSAEQRFNAYRSRYMASTPHSSPVTARTPESAPYMQSRSAASEVMQSSARSQSYRPSLLNNSSMRDFDSVSQIATPTDNRRISLRADRDQRNDGESMISASAPSTMWDELNELRTRIQKIELGEKIASSGGTLSNGSVERPRTATTTITTMSSSPKLPLKSAAATNAAAVGGAGADKIHPLLHQSLVRCKATLNPALYRMLESAASDALEMAVLSGSTGEQNAAYSATSIVNGGITDRQLRRKADNVCRSLTDLCIALCEGDYKNSGVTQAVAGALRESKDCPTATPSPTIVETPNSARIVSQQQTLDPETPQEAGRANPSRALERIEQRRASLMSMQKSPTNNSPLSAKPPPPNADNSSLPASPSLQVSKVPTSRTGSSLLRTRPRAEGDDDESPQRPPSRATTEIGSGSNFRRRANRLSSALLAARTEAREYTSQHPLPNSSTSSALPPPMPLRRVTPGNLKPEAATSPATPSLLARDTSRTLPDALVVPYDDERRAKRRSLGLYTSARASLGLGRRTSTARSVAAAGDAAA